ncbi:MAG: hypothetical protein AAFQ91_24480 [Cyanobacteria bacterium J06621_15]
MNLVKVIEPLLSTWGYKQDAGDWDIQLPAAFVCSSSKEQKKAYCTAITITLDAFSSLIKAYKISILSMSNSGCKGNTVIFEHQHTEDYEDYIARVFKAIDNYSNEIYEIEIKFDLHAYIYTKENYDKPILSWVRYVEKSIAIGEFNISISTEDDEPYIGFRIEHTLFYPSSLQNNNEDNTELFELNQPLLEKALKNWEKKFNSEIEADGLTGVYKYGYLPQDQW